MARLTYRARKHLPKGQFALKGGAGKRAKGRYPIQDKTHARNALARVSQYGTASEKARVRAAVRRKYPSIGR